MPALLLHRVDGVTNSRAGERRASKAQVDFWAVGELLIGA